MKKSFSSFAAFLATLLITLIISTSNGQNITDSTYNYFSLTSYYDHYYDSILRNRGNDTTPVPGYKDYLRWQWFMSRRYGDHGDLGAFGHFINEYYDNYQSP